MKRNKPVLFAALTLAALFAAGTALAQADRLDRQWHHGPPGPIQQLAHLEQALDLTDEQSLELLELLQAAEADREALHTRAMESFQPEACALRERTQAEIMAILTPEQAATLEQLRQERAGRRESRRGAPKLECPDLDD